MKTRQQKEDQVKTIQEKLSRSRSLVFADYQGLTMGQLNQLRAALRDLNAEFSVTKNTLLDIALKNTGKKELPDDVTTGPIATLFAFEDEVTPIKTLVKALKEAGIGKVKAGLLGDNFLDAASINKLATLPDKLELQAQVVGVLAAPLTGMVNVLQGNLRNLVYALDAIRTMRSSQSE